MRLCDFIFYFLSAALFGAASIKSCAVREVRGGEVTVTNTVAKAAME